ncbi:unnamed protein product [Clavelina lepadiformis]|uniref:Uncharacterized protein n=1 Tax=Clavelina lepadiformis TaxID=159417 RepID=A0ABP0FR32_CLALP
MKTRKATLVLFVIFCLTSQISTATIVTRPPSTTCLTSGLTYLLVEAVFEKPIDTDSCAWNYSSPSCDSCLVTFYDHAGCKGSQFIGSDVITCTERFTNGSSAVSISTYLTLGGPLTVGTLELAIVCNTSSGALIDVTSTTRSIEECSLNTTNSQSVISSCAPPCEYNDPATLSCAGEYDGSDVDTICAADCTFVDDVTCTLSNRSDPFRIATIVLGVLLGISLLVWLSYCVWNATKSNSQNLETGKSSDRSVVASSFQQNPQQTFSDISRPHLRRDSGSFETISDVDRDYNQEIEPKRHNSNHQSYANMISQHRVQAYSITSPEPSSIQEHTYDDVMGSSGNGGQAPQPLSLDDRPRDPLPPPANDEYDQPMQPPENSSHHYDVTIYNNCN